MALFPPSREDSPAADVICLPTSPSSRTCFRPLARIPLLPTLARRRAEDRQGLCFRPLARIPLLPTYERYTDHEEADCGFRPLARIPLLPTLPRRPEKNKRWTFPPSREDSPAADWPCAPVDADTTLSFRPLARIPLLPTLGATDECGRPGQVSALSRGFPCCRLPRIRRHLEYGVCMPVATTNQRPVYLSSSCDLANYTIISSASDSIAGHWSSLLRRLPRARSRSSCTLISPPIS